MNLSGPFVCEELHPLCIQNASDTCTLLQSLDPRAATLGLFPLIDSEVPFCLAVQSFSLCLPACLPVCLSVSKYCSALLRLMGEHLEFTLGGFGQCGPCLLPPIIKLRAQIQMVQASPCSPDTQFKPHNHNPPALCFSASSHSPLPVGLAKRVPWPPTLQKDKVGL